MLHSSFWEHAARDLDLPPWALWGHRVSSGLPLGRDDSDRGTARKSQNGKSNTTTEGLFLDFLYPPPALAVLQRANGQQWQRWERRNARRLPDGFVVASRGYASRPRLRNSRIEESDGVVTGRETSRIANDGEGARYKPFSGTINDEPRVKRRQDPERLRDLEILRRPFAKTEPSTAGSFAATPSDLMESELASQTSGATDVEGLRHVMLLSRTGQAKNSAELVKTAINIYDSLDQANRDDVRLRSELLKWLSVQRQLTAKRKCIALYAKLSPEHRTLDIYRAVASARLAQNQDSAVPKIHREALRNVENGDQLSWSFFAYAVDKANWSMAIETWKTHHEHCVSRGEEHRLDVFWLHVAEISELFPKAISFAQFLRTPNGSRVLVEEETRKFCASFFKEALTQEFLHGKVAPSISTRSPLHSVPRRTIRRLLSDVSRAESHAASLFGDILRAILHSKSKAKYAQLHHVVSFIYAKYRKMPDALLPEDTFKMWLDRLTEYADSGIEARMKTANVSMKSLVKEWERCYGRVDRGGIKRLMMYYAKRGLIKPYEKWLAYLREHHAEYSEQKSALWTMIWVHANRADLDRAQQAFAEVSRAAAEHGEEPDTKSWNMLLLAHGRADDLKGALVNLQNHMRSGGRIPDAYAVNTVLWLLARRGDVAGIEDLFRQYDRLSGRDRDINHLGALLTAHINNDDIKAAEVVLSENLAGIRTDESHGPLVGLFNILLTAYATRGDLASFGHIHRWMEQEKIRPNANSYAAKMQALVLLRRPDEAYGILNRVLPREQIKPTAFHYAILMGGYVRIRQPNRALEVYHHMMERRVASTASTNIVLLQAKAMIEYDQNRHKFDDETAALENTIKLLKTFIRQDALLPPRHPKQGLRGSSFDLGEESQAAHFEFLISLHGRQRCFQAVHELQRQYQKTVEETGKGLDAPPIRFLTALAAAQFTSGDYGSLRECWRLAKEQADRHTPLTPVPRLQALQEVDSDLLALQAPLELENTEEDVEELAEESTAQQDADILPLAPQQELPPPAPGRRHVLSGILRWYLTSLSRQNRMLDAIATVTQVLQQGYALTNTTWNDFIKLLCEEKPPLSLLAFVLTERFLTPNFPGWARRTEYPAKPAAIALGRQYMNARNVSQRALMPQYDTVVMLAGALAQMRVSEAMGSWRSSASDVWEAEELEKYRGTVEQIRTRAPMTFAVVQSLPRVADKLQAEALGVEM